MLQRCIFLVAAFFGVSAITIAQTQSVYVASASGSFYDFKITLKDKPSDTDFVCASHNPPGPWTQGGRPCDFILWKDIPADQSIATCNTSDGKCHNQNGGIELYVLKSAITATTTTPPVTPPPPVVAPPIAGVGSFTLNWQACTVNDDKDKTPCNPIGYCHYYGLSLPWTKTCVGNVTTLTVTNLPAGIYYGQSTAVDATGEGNKTSVWNVPVASSTPIPSGPIVTATGGSWSARSGSTNLKTGLSSHDDCLAYLKTQAAGKYSCAFSGETVTVKQ